jgi:hypothetical protein
MQLFTTAAQKAADSFLRTFYDFASSAAGNGTCARFPPLPHAVLLSPLMLHFIDCFD